MDSSDEFDDGGGDDDSDDVDDDAGDEGDPVRVPLRDSYHRHFQTAGKFEACLTKPNCAYLVRERCLYLWTEEGQEQRRFIEKQV